MTRRYFSNSAILSYITSSLNGVDTTSTFSVSDTSGGAASPPSGWPAVPFYAAINRGAADEEVVLVTNVTGSSVTVTRGSNLGTPYGSTTQSHSINATIEHVASAADFDEANAHIEDTTGVHGITDTAALVTLTGTQTLTNKNLTDPTLTSPNIGASEWADANHTHASAATGGTVAHSALTGLTTGDPHTQYQLESEKGAANGYAGLDAGGLVDITDLPTGTGASQVALGDHTHAAYNFSGCKAKRTTDQAIATSSWEGIAFNAADEYDTDSYHDPATNNGRITFPADGYYTGFVQVTWEQNNTGRRLVDIRLNDSSTDATAGSSVGLTTYEAGSNTVSRQQCSFEGYFSAGDYVKAFVWQNSGGSLDIYGATSYPGLEFTVHRIG